MSAEDPFIGIHRYINHQAGLLLNPVIGRDDPFRNGNNGYQRDITHGPLFTRVVEAWPNQDGFLVQRESRFVARQIKRVGVLYPLTSGYDPDFSYLGYFVSFKLKKEDSLSDDWQVYLSRKSYIAGSGFESDYIIYNQGFFECLKLNTEVGKAWTGNPIEIFAPNAALMVGDQVVSQEGVILPNNQVIKGKVYDKGNMVVVSREDRSVGKIDEAYFPLSFNLDRLGTLMLGSNVNLLRNEYPAGYLLTDKNGGKGFAQKAKDAVSLQISQLKKTPVNESLLTHHPAGRACIQICLNNGWEPTGGDFVRLVRLWEEVRQGERSEQILPLHGLKFARWLYAHGRISG